ISYFQQSPQYPLSRSDAPRKVVIVGQPETVCEKSSLGLVIFPHLTPHHEPLPHESFLDQAHRTPDAGIVRRQKSEERQQKQAGIDLARAVALNETSQLRTKSQSADAVMNVFADRTPSCNLLRK